LLDIFSPYAQYTAETRPDVFAVDGHRKTPYCREENN